jgi:malonate-semialdehyde dehydrogenase (acetylating)/methylmalonate-semialdehyde dehydrogenase
VLPEADMDLAADAAVGAAYGSAGERCMAISVLVAVGNAADKLLPKILERIEKIKVDDGMRPGAEMGPLVTGTHLQKVRGYVDAGVQQGAALLRDGRGLKVEGRAEGFFLGPCLFDGVKPGMSIYEDEIFGPVLSVTRVGTYDEAIALVNSNKRANGVAIFTNDGGAARKFQNEIEVGMIGINVPIPVPMAYYSFGGWKQSLFGESSVHGMDGVRFYTRPKVVTSRWPDPRFRGADLGFPTTK